MHILDSTQQILPEIDNQNLKNINFWCVDEGALPPATPINHYLGGTSKKSHFLLSTHLCALLKSQFGAKYGTMGPPRAIYEPRGQDVIETSIVLTTLIQTVSE